MSKETFEEYWGLNNSGQYGRTLRVMAKSVWNHQQEKIQDLEAKLAKAVEYNKTFLGYALADRYQWDGDFLVEVGKQIKALEEIGD
jgi:hypothetical protein